MTEQTRLLTASFDSRAEADRAVDRLVQAGIPRAEIDVIEERSATTSTSGMTSPPSSEDSGFWASLSNLFMPDEDRYLHAEAIRRGGCVLTVHASRERYQQALDILDSEGSVDLDQRSQTWRSEGWQGYQRAAAAPAGLGATAGASAASRASGLGSAPSRLDRTTDLGTGREGAQVIPITEERLRVGKRETEHGRVRVRSYVEEIPVEQSVDLRQEHVDVERRPVDRPIAAGDQAFQERTIEATERRERPVVEKEARVVEEVALRKDVDVRPEKVSDTVRKTKVDIEDERQNGAASGTSGTKRPL